MQTFLTPYPLPWNFTDSVTYINNSFNLWNDPHTFHQISQQKFQLDFTDHFEKSVGCLCRKVRSHFEHLATAFIVKYIPQPSNLLLADGSRRPIKLLLLTAAHVYSSPFSDEEIQDGVFFTLSPTLSDPTFATYSKFRVKRLFTFEPFRTEDPQIDPITHHEFMLPQDVELLAVLETDPQHELRVNDNHFSPLEFQALDHHNPPKQSCVIVGYPAKLHKKHIDIWAPIIGRDLDLQMTAENICESQSSEVMRVFSSGEVIDANKTCMAVTCSTWAGMCGGPICILSKDGKSLKFCGVYNGSAAAPFQALLSKMFYCFQRRNVKMCMGDIPRMPDVNQTKDQLLWVSLLSSFLSKWGRLPLHFGNLFEDLDSTFRNSLYFVEKAGRNVQHNLGVCGGSRFENIMKGLEELKLNSESGVDKVLEFKGLEEIGPDPAFTKEELKRNFQRFLNEGIHAERTKFIFKTEGINVLIWGLERDLHDFISYFGRNKSQKKANGKFKKLWLKFCEIFEILIPVLNNENKYYSVCL